MSPIGKLSILAAAALGAGGIAQAQTTLRSMPKATQSSDVERCGKTAVHLTEAGLAFECMNDKGITQFIFTVSEQNFPGRVEYVLDLLEQAKSSASGSARFSARGLYVFHGAASGKDQAICDRTQKIAGDLTCRAAIDIALK